MANQQSAINNQPFPPGRLRWWIGGLLFLSTVINYIDRQTLSVLAPYLKTEYGWTNTDFALIIIAFRVAYAIGQGGAGRLLDRVGTRHGLSVTRACYSVAAMLTSLAQRDSGRSAASGSCSAPARRQLAGRDQGGRGMVPEARERMGGRALRQRLVDRRGDRAGAGAVACCTRSGPGGPAFILTGALGFVWLLLFRRFYYPPETHPRISQAERDYILADRERRSATDPGCRHLAIATLLRLPQTWGSSSARR